MFDILLLLLRVVTIIKLISIVGNALNHLLGSWGWGHTAMLF